MYRIMYLMSYLWPVLRRKVCGRGQQLRRALFRVLAQAPPPIFLYGKNGLRTARVGTWYIDLVARRLQHAPAHHSRRSRLKLAPPVIAAPW